MYGFGTVPLILFESSHVWRVQFDLLVGPDAGLEKFRGLQDAEISITALSGTIIALIATTSLLLDKVFEIFWLARAMWIFSSICGFFAVYYAANQQHASGLLVRPKQIRDWMTGGDKYKHAKSDFSIPCIASAISISGSKLLLNYALRTYIIGLGVYLYSLWTSNTGPTDDVRSNKIVFYFFVAVTVFCLMLYSQSAAAGYSEQNPWQHYLDMYHGVPDFNGPVKDFFDLPPVRGDDEEEEEDDDEWIRQVVRVLKDRPRGRRIVSTPELQKSEAARNDRSDRDPRDGGYLA
ncbi:MAG: hypothetical protein M1838_005459 [Thelocarpon superellum]|nr:MAG: hypothetical protein M1838_005459 [Thelocarpon superellum]